jgi:GNAT superfamily N-acetyltransferase
MQHGQDEPAGRTSLAPAAGPVALVEAADVAEPQFRRFYNEVLRLSFRPEELVSVDDLLAACRAERSRVPGILALVDGGPVGGILGEYYPDSGVLLIAYLAVRRGGRGGGVGATLLAEARRRWQASHRPTLVLAELEGLHSPSHPGYGDPAARLRFYDRCGARLLPVPYFQPALRPGLPRIPGMLLIGFGAGSDPAPDRVPAATVRAFLEEYFTDCEGAANLRTDPDYLALQAAVDRWPDDAMPLWPLDRADALPSLPGAP